MSDLPTQPGATPSGAPEFKSAPVTETPMTLIGKIEKRFPKAGTKLKFLERKFTNIDEKFQTSLGFAEVGIGAAMEIAKRKTETEMGAFNEKEGGKEIVTTASELVNDGYRRIFTYSAKNFNQMVNQSILATDGGLMASLLIKNIFTRDELKFLAKKHESDEDILAYLEHI